MRIVPADRAHLVGLVELMSRSPLLRRYGVTSPRARASLAEALKQRDLVLVALEAGETLGLAWVITSRALDRAAYLRLLLVAEGEQSHGVGGALLAEAELRARASGCRHLVLLVTTTNRRARAFYARQGYEHVGNLPGFVHPAIGESLYVKSWPRR
jgi:ribosomal protein S18 acetylase RimI-like enzyme